jgi:hypothetical protein
MVDKTVDFDVGRRRRWGFWTSLVGFDKAGRPSHDFTPDQGHISHGPPFFPMFRPLPSLAAGLLAAVFYRYQPEAINGQFNTLSALAQGTLGKLYGGQTQQQAVFTTSTAPLGGFLNRIVAVGDLHGDLPNALRVLKMAEVIDQSENWSGNVDVLAQTGDIIDRGPDTIALYALMDKLRGQAPAKGGSVLSVLGNHEWMNAIGDWRYVYPSELETFGSVEKRQEALSSGTIGRSWATNYTTAARLPLHPSLGPPNTPYDGVKHSNLSHSAFSFVHGGLSPTYENLVPYPTKINEVAASLLAKLQKREQPPPHPPNPYPGLPSTATMDEIKLYDVNGPLWYRGWALEDESTVCASVDEVLDKTGTRRMIMGHTPDFTGIVSRCDGKIIIIDTGISHAYGGVLAALSAEYSLAPLGDGLWEEKELVKALYVDKESQVLVNSTRQVYGDFTLDA